MTLIIDIPMDAYSMIMDTTFTEDEKTMFLQTPEDRLKTMLLFKTLDSIKNGKAYEERPQGEWIDDTNYYANCSNCGYQIDTHYERGYLNFCPNCGADMRGDKDHA